MLFYHWQGNSLPLQRYNTNGLFGDGTFGTFFDTAIIGKEQWTYLGYRLTVNTKEQRLTYFLDFSRYCSKSRI